MTALRIGPDFRQVIVCAPGYLAARGVPQDLLAHDAVMLRLPRSGGLYPWSFARDGQELTVRPKGRGIFNTVALLQQAAPDGLGFVSLPEDLAAGLIAEEHLVRVLADWSLLWPGYHLYCPSRRQPSPAFAIVLEALRRFRG